MVRYCECGQRLTKEQKRFCSTECRAEGLKKKRPFYGEKLHDGMRFFSDNYYDYPNIDKE